MKDLRDLDWIRKCDTLALHQEVEKGSQECQEHKRSPRRRRPQLGLEFSFSLIASQPQKLCLLSVLYRQKIQGADKSGLSLRSRMDHIPKGFPLLYITSACSRAQPSEDLCMSLRRKEKSWLGPLDLKL